MSINPDNISTTDIDAYENLMQGSIAAATSNASVQRGKALEGGFVKHTWNNTNQDQANNNF